ncbi:nucleoside hydrolase [Corynebacterium uterequi]|uniref:Inosine-uridine nucleoside N-ribohydrolase n=1 Tax=Corynebacterium uterequi TaxID=1072256 RepID=A0A0G3HDP2_9CORY|nr:nucleoside hydrolase [Corynebacterium uterequi]AKK10088.1 Inosine-uridine nucleoside N-ribohydrolase [Corynebacterium uterequi]
MIPVIIDNDTAQDDCVTILEGLLDPACDLRAITMVAGNVGFERQVENAAMTVAVAGKLGEVPIHLGASKPLTREWEGAEDVHGDGSGGLHMDIPEGLVSEVGAVDALCAAVAAEPGVISIVAIGPLTNIALAVQQDPDFAVNVKSLYVMGGSNNGRGNITPAAEFNFYVDPEAAQIVLDAGFADLRILTWDPVTLRDVTFPRPRYDELCQLGTPLSRFFKHVCDATIDYDESVGVNGSTHPDSATLACLLHPELVLEQARYRVDVECASDLTRGYSVMAWDKFDCAPNATVFERVDGEAYYARLKALLATPTTPSVELF